MTMARIPALLAIILTTISCAEASVFQGRKCAKVKPMDNLNINKMSGVWYPLVASKGVLLSGGSCFKTTIKILDSGRLQNTYEAQRGNVSLPASTNERNLDPKRPGVLSHKLELEVANIFGKKEKTLLDAESYILYTDYANIELRFSCSDLDNFWVSDIDQIFYIMVRNRSFDSLKQLVPLLNTVRELGFDLNEIEFPKQTSCIVGEL